MRTLATPGLELCAVRSRIFQEIRVADFAQVLRENVLGSAFLRWAKPQWGAWATTISSGDLIWATAAGVWLSPSEPPQNLAIDARLGGPKAALFLVRSCTRVRPATPVRASFLAGHCATIGQLRATVGQPPLMQCQSWRDSERKSTASSA